MAPVSPTPSGVLRDVDTAPSPRPARSPCTAGGVPAGRSATSDTSRSGAAAGDPRRTAPPGVDSRRRHEGECT